MNQYLLTIYQPDGPPPPPATLDAVMKNVREVRAAMEAAGAWVYAAGLDAPEKATVVRPDRDALLMTDGPFTEAKEHIGGFCVVRASDLDAALDWAGRLARATTLPVEVRAVREEGRNSGR